MHQIVSSWSTSTTIIIQEIRLLVSTPPIICTKSMKYDIHNLIFSGRFCRSGKSVLSAKKLEQQPLAVLGSRRQAKALTIPQKICHLVDSEK